MRIGSFPATTQQSHFNARLVQQQTDRSRESKNKKLYFSVVILSIMLEYYSLSVAKTNTLRGHSLKSPNCPKGFTDYVCSFLTQYLDPFHKSVSTIVPYLDPTFSPSPGLHRQNQRLSRTSSTHLNTRHTLAL